jgi:hypothetical protein
LRHLSITIKEGPVRQSSQLTSHNGANRPLLGLHGQAIPPPDSSTGNSHDTEVPRPGGCSTSSTGFGCENQEDKEEEGVA